MYVQITFHFLEIFSNQSETTKPALQHLPAELGKGCFQPFCFPTSFRAGDTTLGLTLCYYKMLPGNSTITAFHKVVFYQKALKIKKLRITTAILGQS